MELSGKEVFIKKVLERLYGETSSSPVHTSSGKEEVVLINLGSKSKENDLENVQALSADASTSSGMLSKSSRGSDTAVPPSRRMYTVSPPPEGYVAATPDTSNITVSENSESSSDSTDEEHQVQTKRRRIRRKKLKNSLQDSNTLRGEQVEFGMQEALVRDNLQLQQIDSPKISKNKRRKMKKKRQKEKMRAAGLLTKTTGVDFTYQPDKNNREGTADLKDADEKADSILDFLQATQQIYFADNKSKRIDSTVTSAAAQGLLQCLESRSVSSSDVTLLHRLKSLVLLQDIERLQDALKQFQEHSMMPPGLTQILLKVAGILLVLQPLDKPLLFPFLQQKYQIEEKREANNNQIHTVMVTARYCNSSSSVPKNLLRHMVPSVCDLTQLMVKQGPKFNRDLEIMVIPLRRMTPGYIRLLQTQAAGKIVINSSDVLLQRTALFLGMFGISLSSYSTHQLAQQKRLSVTL